jgi:hypothetical protein
MLTPCSRQAYAYAYAYAYAVAIAIAIAIAIGISIAMSRGTGGISEGGVHMPGYSHIFQKFFNPFRYDYYLDNPSPSEY